PGHVAAAEVRRRNLRLEVRDPTLLALIGGGQNLQDTGPSGFVSDPFNIYPRDVSHRSSPTDPPQLGGCQVFPERWPISRITAACQSRTSASGAGRVAHTGGTSGAPIWIAMAARSSIGRPAATHGKRMPIGTILIPVSSESRAAPLRPGNNRVGSRLTV